MTEQSVTLAQLQELIEEMYGPKDRSRAVSGTFMWLMEEMGELSAELRDYESTGIASENLSREFADVLAWLVTIANVANVNLTKAFMAKYGTGCPGCGKMVCDCDDAEKP